MSTYSTSLKLTLIGDGEQSGTWGQTTNTNLGTLLEQAITGVANITMSNADYTLTDLNGVSDEARNAVLVVGGTNSAVRNIIAPSVPKLYIVRNATSGGYAIGIKTSGGAAFSVPNGVTTAVYCDGSTFYEQQTGTGGNFSIGGAASVTGNTSVGGNLTVTGTGAFTGDLTAPTQTAGNSSTKVATTAFVGTAITNATGSFGTMSTQNANNVNITGGTVSGVAATGLTSLATSSTSSVTLATGTTAQRPGTPLVGMFRMNTSLNMPEWYDPINARWNLFSDLVNTYLVEYLVVGGGGGGGGYYYAGGGGGGGINAGSFVVVEGTSYTVGVGIGGTGGTSSYAYSNGKSGTTSRFGSILAPGGGGGGSYNDRLLGIGKDGGCGGGNSGYYPTDISVSGGYNMRGVGMMGYSGGYGGGYGGAGGGGAGANGSNGSATSGGAGGAGLASTISGSSVTYAGGGGGGAYTGSGGSGGSGGGGAGATGVSAANGANGTDGLGGGGGGGSGNNGASSGGDGGDGIVIVRYFGSTARATGGTVTNITVSGAPYVVHTFTTSGTFLA